MYFCTFQQRNKGQVRGTQGEEWLPPVILSEAYLYQVTCINYVSTITTLSNEEHDLKRQIEVIIFKPMID